MTLHTHHRCTIHNRRWHGRRVGKQTDSEQRHHPLVCLVVNLGLCLAAWGVVLWVVVRAWRWL